MFSSVHIQGYRAFKDFEMADLGRVNLLVGTNNSGKTSVLEALYLLASCGDPSSITTLLSRRCEQGPSDESYSRHRRQEFDISHLFTGHDLSRKSILSLSARSQVLERSVTFSIAIPSPREQAILKATGDNIGRHGLALRLIGTPAPPVPLVALSDSLRMISDSIDLPPVSELLGRSQSAKMSCQFITTESFSGQELVRLWDKIALTTNQDLVLQALQFLDPQIEGIAPQISALSSGNSTRGGFVLKLKGRENPLPIGSMGDGVWRLLAMAIAIAHCKGGILLVDEIDSGLHHTVLSNMWKLICSASKELNVQVFTTTHSADCIQALATVCGDEEHHDDGIRIHRIEPSKGKSITFDEDEIIAAADSRMELRGWYE